MMTREVWQLRILAGASERLRGALAAMGAGPEPVALGLFSPSTQTRSLILRDVVALPRDQLVDGWGVRAQWSHRLMVDYAASARQKNAGLCVLHRHRGRGVPGLSFVDRQSFSETLGLQDLFPGLPLASVVFSQDWHAAGVFAGPSGAHGVVEGVTWYGKWIERLPAPAPFHRDRGQRHDALWGPIGEGLLREACVGIVGVGGGGSHFVQQFAHSGIGRIVAVDADPLEIGNRSRTVGTRRGDLKKLKLAAMKRLARDAGDDCRFAGVPHRFPELPAVEELAACDVIMGAVDTLHVRKQLTDFVLQHALPYVDIGLTIVPTTPHPGIDQVGGQVFVGIPGRRCMWCAGILSEARLAAERDPDGYVRGGGAAQTVAFNGVLASQAVGEVLALLTGCRRHADAPPAKIVYDGRQLFVPELPESGSSCPWCADAGSGDVEWDAGLADDSRKSKIFSRS